MIKEFLAQSPHLIFPLVGLVIFLTMFLMVLGYVFIGLRRSGEVAPLAALPFEDGQLNETAERAAVSTRGEVKP